MQTSSRNNTIDAFRLILSFLIITLHIQYGSHYKTIINLFLLLARCGVPFFFITSGYFYQLSLDKGHDAAIIKSVKKICKIIVAANLIYLPILFVLKQPLFQWKYFINGDFLQLWFLQSLLIGFITIGIINKYRVDKLIQGLIAAAILVAGLLFDSYLFIFHKSTGSLFNFYIRPLLSIPFMLTGGYLSKKQTGQRLNSSKTGILLLITGLILQLSEAVYIKKINNTGFGSHTLLFGTIIASVGLFILSLNVLIKNTELGKLGERYSLFIYLYHPIFIGVLLYINYTLYLNEFCIFLLPVIIFSATFILGILLYRFLPQLFKIITGGFKLNKIVQSKSDKNIYS